MSDPAEPIVLDLRTLPEQCELLPSTCASMAAAASVTLERLHGGRDRDRCRVVERDGSIVRVEVTKQTRDTYDDPEEATEEGADAIAILVARHVLDRIVFRRLPKKTGADYRMRRSSEPDQDNYERLECSGIGEGKDSAQARLKEKLAQLASYSAHRSGHAVVTRFGREPVEIVIGKHPR